jgi:hypothetical protein
MAANEDYTAINYPDALPPTAYANVSNNVLPNIMYSNSCFILEENTRGPVINAGDLHDCNDLLEIIGNQIPLPADGADRDVFVIFQATLTPYAVVGGRVIDDGY